MKNLFKISLLLFIFLIITTSIEAKVKKSPEWKYDVECVSNGADGSYVIKVWSYWKNNKMPSALSMQNAVHAILFRGYPAGEQGCKGQKPIAKSPSLYNDKNDFFSAFFGEEGGNGDYQKYVNIVSPAPEIIKVNKKEYKIGVVVSVSKDLLRKDMEEAGIIKGLSSGF